MLPAILGPVLVRSIFERDHEAHLALENDPEIKRFVGGCPERSLEEQLQDLRCPPSQACLAVADSATDRYIGRCGLILDVMGTNAELHCVLTQASWGHGIGPAVMKYLVDLARSQDLQPFGRVHPENDRSLRMLRSLGWIEVGRHTIAGKQFNHIIVVPSDG